MAYIVVPYDIGCNCIRAIWELRLMSASADVFAVSAVTVARGSPYRVNSASKRRCTEPPRQHHWLNERRPREVCKLYRLMPGELQCCRPSTYPPLLSSRAFARSRTSAADSD